jgi:hypothetical protein
MNNFFFWQMYKFDQILRFVLKNYLYFKLYENMLIMLINYFIVS